MHLIMLSYFGDAIRCQLKKDGRLVSSLGNIDIQDIFDDVFFDVLNHQTQ